MHHYKYSLFIVVIIVLLMVGSVGFSLSESISPTDGFHNAIQAITFSSNTHEYSSEGRLLNSALALASVVLIIWGFVNFHYNRSDQRTDTAQDYFKLAPSDEGLVLKEITLAKGSKFANKTKMDILRERGVVVFGVKQKSNYTLNVPLDKKLTGGTIIIALGTPTQLGSFQREVSK